LFYGGSGRRKWLKADIADVFPYFMMLFFIFGLIRLFIVDAANILERSNLKEQQLFDYCCWIIHILILWIIDICRCNCSVFPIQKLQRSQ